MKKQLCANICQVGSLEKKKKQGRWLLTSCNLLGQHSDLHSLSPNKFRLGQYMNNKKIQVHFSILSFICCSLSLIYLIKAWKL